MLLSRLASLVSERSRGAMEARASYDAAREAAMLTYRDAVKSAESEFNLAAGALEAQRRTRAEVIESKHRERMEEDREVFERQIKEFRSRTAATEAAAARKLEDGQWLLDTMIESGEGKLKKEFDAARRGFASLNERLDVLGRDAQAELEKLGHRPLPAPPPDAQQWAVPDDLVGMKGKCDELVSSAESAARMLRKRIRPRLLGPATFVFAPMLLVAAGAGLGFALGEPERARSALIAAGAGVALSLVVFAPLRLMLRRRVPPAGEALSRAIAEARRTIEHCLRQADALQHDRKEQLRKNAESEAQKVRLEVNQLRYEAYRRRTEEEPVLVVTHERAIVARRGAMEDESRNAAAEFDRRRAELERSRDESLRVAERARDAALDVASRTMDETLGGLRRAWDEGTRQCAEEIGVLQGFGREIAPAWDAARWDDAPAVRDVPPLVPLGSLRVQASDLPGGLPSVGVGAAPEQSGFDLPFDPTFDLPVGLDLLERGSVLLQSGADGRSASLDAMRNVMLRLLTSLPPGKVRFTIVDPIGLGQSFAGFMHLADYEQQLVGDKIWTEPRHVEQKLTDLTEHMETVIQKYLRNEFSTIQEYNARAGEVAEPFRFLVIADFPAGFSEASAKRLASIVASGPRCGVFTLISLDSRQRPPAWVPLPDLERGSVNLVWRGGGFVWSEDQFNRWALSVERPPDDERFNRLIHAVGRSAKDSSRVQVPFETVAPRAEEMWTRGSGDELRVPIGRSGATKVQSLALGRGTSQHALIAGRTGSGKSTLLHAIITSAALWYSPDEIEMYLVDFKKGVEFKTYATNRLPHARVIAVESEREFGLSVLRRLDAELTRRGELYRARGVQDLAGYRRQATSAAAGDVAGAPGRVGEGANPVLPRVLLIVDEFQEFFVADDKIGQEASLLLDRLVRQGRAFGVHVILGSQTIGGVYSLARSTIGQMAVRVALQCSEADSYLILSEDNAAARLLSRPGEAIYNDASGMVEGNSPFQVVWLPDEKRDEFLDAVRSRAASAERAGDGAARPARPSAIVFEGNVPSDLSRNDALMGLIESARGVDASAANVIAGAGPARAWLGEAISIKDPTALSFKRQSSANAIIVGQQDLPALAMTTGLALSLSAHAAARARSSSSALAAGASGGGGGLPPVLIVDGSVIEDGSTGPLELIGSSLGGIVRRAGVRDVDALIADLYAELDRRRQPGAPEGPALHLIVFGLQRFRTLRRAEEDFGFGSESGQAAKPDQQFAQIVRDGPSVGIHTIMWVNTAATLERSMDRRALREFDARILFQMSQADSTMLIDGPQAATLGQHRALLFSEETGVIEKFRPYAPPTAEWLRETLAKLSGSVRTA